MSFKIQIPLSAPKEVTFCGFFFYAKMRLMPRKYQPLICPGHDVSVFVFVSFVSECVRLACGLSEVIVYG